MRYPFFCTKNSKVYRQSQFTALTLGGVRDIIKIGEIYHLLKFFREKGDRVNAMAMKIDSGMSRNAALTMTRSETDAGVRGADTDFSMELADQEQSMSREAMDRLLEQIDEQGARLSKTPTFDELRSYRALIQSFIGEAVGSMYELRTQAGWDRLGRQKVYTSVRKIDKKLEEIAEKIRLGQADQLDIIASHDAIRGMLVDLYM